jgi:AcrR family transcriptional regulator
MVKKVRHKHGRPRADSRVLTRESILAVAFEISNEIGYENLSIKKIAEKLDIRPPSVYNHITDLADILNEIAAKTLTLLAKHLENAINVQSLNTKDKGKIFMSMVFAYREFARNNAGVYPSTLSAPGENEQHKLAAAQMVNVAMLGLGLKSALNSEAIHKIRILRAALHGFVSLEAAGGFGLPESVDETFLVLAQTLAQNLISVDSI